MMEFNYSEWRALMVGILDDKWSNAEKIHEAVANNFSTHPWSLLPEDIRQMYRNRSLELKKERNQKIHEKLIHSNIPMNNLYSEKDKYTKLANEIKKRLPFVLVIGDIATHKTDIIRSVVYSLIEEASIYYCVASEYQSDCEEKVLIGESLLFEYTKKIDLFIIDNLGMEHIRYRNYIMDVIKWRIDNLLPTIYVTNLNKNLFDEKYSLIGKRVEKKIINVMQIGG